MISSFSFSFLKVTMGPKKYSLEVSNASQSPLGMAKVNRSSHNVEHSSSDHA